MKCRNDALLAKISAAKLEENDEITFAVLKELPDCRKIITKRENVVSSKSKTLSFNKWRKPDNAFECMRTGCINSGTLFITPQDETGDIMAAFRVYEDATEFVAGVITLYIHKANDNMPITGTVAISSDAEFTNANVYNYTLDKADFDADGYAPVFIHLADVPASTEGDGWSPSAAGAYIRITAAKNVDGISSIFIFDSITDFETSSVVKIACLTSIEGADEIEAAEARCLESGYNTADSPTFERTIAGRLLTPNFWDLDPFIGRGDKVAGYDFRGVEKTVEKDGETHGKVILPDYNADECGFVSVAISDSCDKTDAQLIRLGVPGKVAIDEKHYIVVADENGATIYFNKALVGMKVTISYPTKAEIEHYVASMDNVGTKRVRMSVPRKHSDGTKWIYTYNNVLVTSFPHNQSNEVDTDVEFSVTIQRDENGHYYELSRIVG